jgi:hypothetical protein
MPRFPDSLAGSRSKSGESCLAEIADIEGFGHDSQAESANDVRLAIETDRRDFFLYQLG